MVRINIADYINDLSNSKFEAKSFEEIKKDLEELYEDHIFLEEIEKSNFFAPKTSMYIDNDTFVQTGLLISEIKEKQEISGRLSSLSYSIGWLKTGVLIKDENIVSKAIKSIMKNDYSSISKIVSELNFMKNRLGKLKNLHTKLLDKNMLSLDIRILMQQEFESKHEKLNELHNKQKNILLNLSSIFVKLTKETMLKKRNK